MKVRTKKNIESATILHRTVDEVNVDLATYGNT